MTRHVVCVAGCIFEGTRLGQALRRLLPTSLVFTIASFDGLLNSTLGQVVCLKVVICPHPFAD